MIFRLGWRNIWRNKRRTFVILTAVVIGVWSMIFLGALMRGIADRMVENSISTLTGHIQIQSAGYRNDPVIENRIQEPGKILNALDVLPAETLWAPRLRANAVASNARHSGGLTMVGIDPAREAKVSFIGNAVTDGRYIEEDDPYGILVGRALLEKFETRVGNKLVLMSQGADGEIASRAFRIAGVFDAELESTEKSYVFVNIKAAQGMLKVDDDLSEIAILLDGYRDADAVADGLRKVVADENTLVYTWKQLVPMVAAVLKMYDGFIFFWFVVVFVAMGFGLVNTILMAVFERVREFGLLRSIGMKPRLVIAEVLAESFYLLAIGTFAGNALGFATVFALSGEGIDLSAFAAGMEFAGMSRVIVPVVYLKDVVVADLTVFILGLSISMYPAVKASRFSPVEAMAHN